MIQIPPQLPLFDSLGRPIRPEPFNPGLIPGMAPFQLDAQTPQPMQQPTMQQQISPQVLPVAQAMTSAPQMQSLTVQPTPEQPVERMLREQVGAMPTPDQFSQGRLRRVLNAIAGGLAGAAGGPAAGIQVGQELSQGPYKRAMTAWKEKGAALKEPAELEKTRVKSGMDWIDMMRQAGVSAAQIEHIMDQRRRMEAQTEEGKERVKIEKDRTEIAKTRAETTSKHYEAMAKNNPIALAREAVDPNNPNREAAEKALKAHRSASRRTPEEISADTTAATEARLKAESGPFGAAAAGTRARATGEARADLKKEEEEKRSEAISFAANNFIASNTGGNSHADRALLSMQYSEWVKRLSSADRAALMRSSSHIPPLVGTKQIADLEISRTALNHVRTVEEYLKDPFVKKNLGAITGRIKIAEGIIGGNALGRTAEEQEAEQAFLTALNNLLLWEVKNIAGARPAVALVERMKHASPRAVMGEGQIKGALKSVEQSIDNRILGVIGNKSTTVRPPTTENDDIEIGPPRKVK